MNSSSKFHSAQNQMLAYSPPLDLERGEGSVGNGGDFCAASLETDRVTATSASAGSKRWQPRRSCLIFGEGNTK
jgi:hypothetical protein